MKVLLAHRAPDEASAGPADGALPAGLPWLAARVAMDGREAAVANFSRLPWKQVEAYVAEAAPDVVGISCLTFNRHVAVRLARVVRRAAPKATVLLGGPHATALADILLARVREVAAVAVGEGEEALAGACARVAAGQPLAGLPGLVVRGAASVPARLSDVEALARPVVGLRGAGLEPMRDLVHVVAARSRPAGPARRSGGSVAAEMQELAAEFGVVEPRLVGPGLADPAWLHDLAASLRDRRHAAAWEMAATSEELGAAGRDDALQASLVAAREAGLRRVRLVLDDQQASRLDTAELAEVSRKLRAAGVAPWLTMRIGGLGETFGTRWLNAMRGVVRALRPAGGEVEPLHLLPGTAEWSRLRDEEELEDAWWFEESRPSVPLASEAATERAAQALEAVLREVAREALPGPRDLTTIEARGESAWTHVDWGDFRAAHGDADEAERRYRLAAALEPWSPFPWLRLAALFRRGRGAPEREAAALQQVLQRVRRHAASRDRLEEIKKTADRRASGARRPGPERR